MKIQDQDIQPKGDPNKVHHVDWCSKYANGEERILLPRQSERSVKAGGQQARNGQMQQKVVNMLTNLGLTVNGEKLRRVPQPGSRGEWLVGTL